MYCSVSVRWVWITVGWVSCGVSVLWVGCTVGLVCCGMVALWVESAVGWVSCGMGVLWMGGHAVENKNTKIEAPHNFIGAYVGQENMALYICRDVFGFHTSFASL